MLVDKKCLICHGSGSTFLVQMSGKRFFPFLGGGGGGVSSSLLLGVLWGFRIVLHVCLVGRYSALAVLLHCVGATDSTLHMRFT